MAKAVNLIIGIILSLIGVFYAVMTHSVHVSSGLGFGFSHGTHILLGIILLIVGILLIIVSRKK